MYTHIYIYIYVLALRGLRVQASRELPGASRELPRGLEESHPLKLALCLRQTLLRFVDSNFPGNSPWAWEFHPLNLRFCLSQTL